MPTRRNFERCEPPTKKWHHSSICQVFWHDTFMPPWAGRNQIDVWFVWYILPCPSQVIFLFSRSYKNISGHFCWGIMFTPAACTQSQLGGCVLTWARTVACCYDSIIIIWLRFRTSRLAACRLIDAHIALILLSACGTIFVRKHCSHEEYGLGARGRIYGAAKVHHAGFSPACGSWDEAKVLKTNSVMKTAHERRICTMCIHVRICFQIMHSGSWGPMIAASCLAQLYRRARRARRARSAGHQGQDFGGEEPLRQGAGLAMVAMCTVLTFPWQIGCSFRIIQVVMVVCFLPGIRAPG